MAATSAHQADPALLHPAHIAAGVGSASPPVHGGQHDATSAPGSGYGQHQSYPVDPSPSTSTSGSTSAAALPPVPCFSELSWVDQYGPYADLDGAGGAAFDSAAALGSLGLDGLDLGPADGDVYPDSTLLDYLNSACTGGGAMMTMMGGGNAAHGSCAMGGHDGDYGPPSWRTDELCQAAARKLGDHQWGGGI
ncbi:trichome differentiation protein GL1-like [Panicum miliaceum]|uniref:Trichome differentiation protein GL1-like n=1 Tax=Panicum miliaceum TaxID=4540 RepID=A0A3L6STX9_PANMI|nr:trichome differentiation protein GL1-like [Panicum miliaceum]